VVGLEYSNLGLLGQKIHCSVLGTDTKNL
jgi:hypothetical protein